MRVLALLLCKLLWTCLAAGYDPQLLAGGQGCVHTQGRASSPVEVEGFQTEKSDLVHPEAIEENN